MSSTQTPPLTDQSTDTTTQVVTLNPDLLKACIHCGFCLPACPTYLATGSEAESPRGRLYLMKKVLDNTENSSLDNLESIEPHLDHCLGCRGCESVCPSGVEYGALLFESRRILNAQPPTVAKELRRFVKRFAFKYVLPNRSLLMGFRLLLLIYQKSGLQGFIRHSNLLGFAPALSQREKLLPTLQRYSPLNSDRLFGPIDGERVVLFTGCVMDTFYNAVHWATIDVLIRNGYRVYIPEQTCCGALAKHSGEADIAEALARQNLDTILTTNPHWIVINSAGCGAALKEYPDWFPKGTFDHGDAKQFSNKVVDIIELLTKKPLVPPEFEVNRRVTYHPACHLHHAQKIQDEPLQLLSQIPGLTLIPLPHADRCCGSAGIYNLEHPELSEPILVDKITAIRQTQADTVATANPGCLLQIQSGLEAEHLPIDIVHPIELLAEAYTGKTYTISSPLREA